MRANEKITIEDEKVERKIEIKMKKNNTIHLIILNI